MCPSSELTSGATGIQGRATRSCPSQRLGTHVGGALSSCQPCPGSPGGGVDMGSRPTQWDISPEIGNIGHSDTHETAGTDTSQRPLLLGCPPFPAACLLQHELCLCQQFPLPTLCLNLPELISVANDQRTLPCSPSIDLPPSPLLPEQQGRPRGQGRLSAFLAASPPAGLCQL